MRDHCLYTGKYRGAAHGICNLRYKTQREIPVVIYNGSNYDYHLIIKELSKEFEAKVNCLGENTEKYITFSVPPKKINKNGKLITYKLKFIDSYRFMQTSLSNLTANLAEINNKNCKKCMERNKIELDCKYIKHKKNKLIYKCKKCNDISAKPINGLIEKFSNTYKFCNKDLDKFILLLRKSVYPYEYMDSWERFNETKLPSKKNFYNNFYLEGISDEDYNHAQKVWDTLRIKNLGEYHDLYIQSNTSLLPDVFEKFRDKCIEIYELDSAHFLSAPGLAWMACLKKTNICLELLADINMLLMIEKGIRGGILQAVHKYAKANNKYMKSYNKNVVSSYLMYLDANNLYGWTMCNKLPVSGFKWANDLSKYTKNFIKNYDENSNKGCIFEVDIEYPKELWSHHKDLPFLPERKKLKKTEKLVTSIEDKEKYVVHIRALKQALNNGLILKKVHRVIEFNQDAWLKPYIVMNTRLRMKAKNEFEKDFFKLMNTSVSGKTMENVRNHRDIKLVTTKERRKKLVSEPNYHTTKHFSENLLAIEMNKTKIIMNKSVYLGQAILDISKTLMYEFWYNYIKPIYKEKAQLCYMDTDSFIIYIETEDFYKDIANDAEKWFDTSNYNKNDERPLPIGENKKVIGMFKDELGGKIMKEFCGNRAKTYAFLLDDDCEKKRAKGTKKCVIKRLLKFADYKDSLFKNKIILMSQLRFKSDCQTVYTKEINRVAISSNDDKRLQTFDKVTTYPYGTNTFKLCESEMLSKI